MHETYGIDTHDHVLMANRSYHWLKDRVVALFSAETRVSRWARSKIEDKK